MLLSTLITMLGWLPSAPGAQVVLGRQFSRFLVKPTHPELTLFEYENNGYLQKVVRGERAFFVDVSVKNSLMFSKARGHHVASLPRSLRGLEHELNAAAGGYLADQITHLIGWLRTEIRYQQDDRSDQSVVEVLRRGSANCVGMSNLALFVLEKMGVRARYVTGVTYKQNDRVNLLLEGSVLHRWIEIFYEDVGWVFCDPAGKVNFVEATYLVLGIQNRHPLPQLLERALGARVELLRFHNGFQTVGALPGLEGTLRVRPNRLYVEP